MAKRPTHRLASGFQQLLARWVPAPESDAELLARFAADRDEAAFAALVGRHGSLVVGAAN